MEFYNNFQFIAFHCNFQHFNFPIQLPLEIFFRWKTLENPFDWNLLNFFRFFHFSFHFCIFISLFSSFLFPFFSFFFLLFLLLCFPFSYYLSFRFYFRSSTSFVSLFLSLFSLLFIIFLHFIFFFYLFSIICFLLSHLFLTPPFLFTFSSQFLRSLFIFFPHFHSFFLTIFIFFPIFLLDHPKDWVRGKPSLISQCQSKVIKRQMWWLKC